MTDLSPYQITSAKSAPVLPPKVVATQPPIASWDQEALAAAMKADAKRMTGTRAMPPTPETMQKQAAHRRMEICNKVEAALKDGPASVYSLSQIVRTSQASIKTALVRLDLMGKVERSAGVSQAHRGFLWSLKGGAK